MRTILLILISFNCYAGDCYQTVNGVKVPCSQEYLGQAHIDSISARVDSLAIVRKKATRLMLFNNAKRLKGATATGLSITDMRDLFILFLDDKGGIDSLGKIRDLELWAK